MKRWHGNSDHCTAETYFGYEKTANRDCLQADFTRTLRRLRALARMRDGNGRPLIQFVFERHGDDEPVNVVAYRFTSDWAYGLYRDALIKVGGSLGRGVWRPFSDKHQFDQWFGEFRKAA